LKETVYVDVELAPEELARLFTFISYRVVEAKEGNGQARSEATMLLRRSVGGMSVHTAANGNGPVNALDRVFRRALEGMYPAVNEITLDDYKVKIIVDGKALVGTASAVEVSMFWTDGRRHWQTHGRSENVVEASWKALLAGFVYKLLKDNE
jgi:2-isopropylmalate synthase